MRLPSAHCVPQPYALERCHSDRAVLRAIEKSIDLPDGLVKLSAGSEFLKIDRPFAFASAAQPARDIKAELVFHFTLKSSLGS
ncbi:MAG: hypothetical protein KJ622_09475 [Alphaproteobacteria bacterium]|nr:hypothetical protein [Alphaproteobacteria bacterium]